MNQLVGVCYYDAGSTNPVLYDNLKGWNLVGSGREFQEEGDMCMPMADSH